MTAIIAHPCLLCVTRNQIITLVAMSSNAHTRFAFVDKILGGFSRALQDNVLRVIVAWNDRAQLLVPPNERFPLFADGLSLLLGMLDWVSSTFLATLMLAARTLIASAEG